MAFPVATAAAAASAAAAVAAAAVAEMTAGRTIVDATWAESGQQSRPGVVTEKIRRGETNEDASKQHAHAGGRGGGERNGEERERERTEMNGEFTVESATDVYVVIRH